MNHSEDCRQRIEEKISEDEPERYSRVLGRLAEGVLKEGTLGQGTLGKDRGRQIDARKMKDIEFRKKIKHKEDRKEERK